MFSKLLLVLAFLIFSSLVYADNLRVSEIRVVVNGVPQVVQANLDIPLNTGDNTVVIEAEISTSQTIKSGTTTISVQQD